MVWCLNKTVIRCGEHPRDPHQERKKQRTEEAKHALEVLPGNAWLLIFKKLSSYDHVAFASTCNTFLEVASPEKKKKKKKKKKALSLRTDLTNKTLFNQMPCFSLSWFQWVFHSFKRKKGEPQRWGRGKYYDHLYDSDLMQLAAFQGSIKAIKWLRSQGGIPLDIKGKDHEIAAPSGAAAGGHIDVLEWLRSEGCGFDRWTCRGAAMGGHLDVLQWLQSQDPPCDWNEWTCAGAAQFGHLHILQWARSQDPPCPWNEYTCSYAAQFGHLDVLQWLRSQDPPCPWNSETCYKAAEGGHLEVLQWARSQDPPCPWNKETGSFHPFPINPSCHIVGFHLHLLLISSFILEASSLRRIISPP
ncbi:hypothetical protein HOP50_05g37710 [Chloropicon primus]|nr:hypothetical protein HOP50_05g37710 [Chloropicon primus]